MEDSNGWVINYSKLIVVIELIQKSVLEFLGSIKLILPLN